MASTNKTTHYNLSQYIGTDKPTYLVDYNTDMANIDAGIYGAKSEAEVNTAAIGTLSNLETTAKNNLVNAINELKGKTDGIGNLSNLTTEAQSNLVNAINEVDAHADANNQNIGTMVNLETTVKTSLVGAINEVNTKAGNNTTNIGDLSNLETPIKTDLVNSINSIIESGSNSNGEYIKYADGTMICYKNVTSQVAMTTVWADDWYEGQQDLGNFPQEFISAPEIYITNVGSSGGILECFQTAPTTTSAGIITYCRAGATTRNIKSNVMAIGKWK